MSRSWLAWGRFARRLGCCWLLSLAALSPTVAAAQGGGAALDGWRVQLTPYLWAAGVGGEIRPGSRLPTLKVDASFRDILSDLDAGLFVAGLAVRDRLVLAADLSYVATSRRGTLPLPAPVAARGGVEQFSVTAMAGARVLRGPGYDLDLLAGLRVWRIEAEAEARLLAAPVLVQQSARLSWADPLLAARFRVDLAPRLSAHLLADLGGFGVGSRFTWQVTGLLNWQLRENLFVSAGYRHLAVDYRSGGRRLDVALSGPVLGLTLRF